MSLTPILVSMFINMTSLPVDDLMATEVNRIDSRITITTNTFTTHTEFLEPSGLDIKNNILYVISDNSKICTYKLDNLGIKNCKSIKRKRKGLRSKRDYEGIALDSDNNVYVAEEGKDNIILLDKNFERKTKYNLNRRFNGKKVIKNKIYKDGGGLESLTFYKKNNNKLYFFTTNQSSKLSGKDRSAILLIEINKINKDTKIVSYFPVNTVDLSAVTFTNNNLYVVSDTTNQLFVFNIKNNTLKLKKRYYLKGKDQEGIAFDNDNMYIAEDSTGDIVVYKVAASEALTPGPVPTHIHTPITSPIPPFTPPSPNPRVFLP